MRNRDQFDPYSFDTYRGLDTHRGNRGIDHNYGMFGHHHHHGHETYHGSEYSFGADRGYGTNHMGNSHYRTAGSSAGYIPESHREQDESQLQYNRLGDRPDQSRGWHRQEDTSYDRREREHPGSGWGSHSGLTPDQYAGGFSTGYGRAPYGSGSYDTRHETHHHEPVTERYRHHPDHESHYDEDRGWLERSADEVRSWFGDDEAERRRVEDRRYDIPHHNHW